jgi:hypothetical protein
MCRTTSVDGHTFVDRPGSEYVDMLGRRRVWRDCVGCGNVTNRGVEEIDADRRRYILFAIIGGGSHVFAEHVRSVDVAATMRRARRDGWHNVQAVREVEEISA